jgi:hypothetical protein
MTLFQAGGDDAALDIILTMVTSKVTSFLFVNPIHPLVNGILLHTPYCDHARFTSTPMGFREEAMEARGLQSDKVHVWKRRRKKIQSSRTSTTAHAPGAVLLDTTTG